MDGEESGTTDDEDGVEVRGRCLLQAPEEAGKEIDDSLYRGEQGASGHPHG